MKHLIALTVVGLLAACQSTTDLNSTSIDAPASECCSEGGECCAEASECCSEGSECADGAGNVCPVTGASVE